MSNRPVKVVMAPFDTATLQWMFEKREQAVREAAALAARLPDRKPWYRRWF